MMKRKNNNQGCCFQVSFKIAILTLFFTLPLPLFSSIFVETYGGASSEYGMTIVQTPDNGFAVAGYNNSGILLLRMDNSGLFQWAKTYGGNVSTAMVNTSDGGFAIAGYSYFASDNPDFYILKLDGSGNVTWARRFGWDSWWDEEYAYSIIQTSDNGYAICGITEDTEDGWPDIIVLKLNSSGSFSWANIFYTQGSYDDDIASSITETSDGGLAIGGFTDNGSSGSGDYDFLLTKFSSSGTFQWARTLGSTAPDYGYSLFETNDGGYAATGYTNSYGVGAYDVLLAKLESDGNCCIGTYVSPIVQSISPTVGTPSVVVGALSSSLLSTASVSPASQSLTQTEVCTSPGAVEETFFLATAELDHINLKWNIDAEIGCLEYRILKKFTKDKDYSEIARIPGSGSSPSPKTYSYKDEDVQPGIEYFYKLGVIKENGNTKWYGPVSAVVTAGKPFLSISPNPFISKTVIRYSSIVNSKDSHLTPYSLRIYDTCGRLVKQFTIHDLRFKDVTWDGKDDYGKQLPSGIYYIRLTQGSLTETKKLLFVK